MMHVEMIIDYVTDETDFQYADNHGVLTRCKDCKHHYSAVTCGLNKGMWFDESYCSMAERREVNG